MRLCGTEYGIKCGTEYTIMGHRILDYFYSNFKNSDIFEKPVEKCPRSLNLNKIWPRYGQNKINYGSQKYANNDGLMFCRRKYLM